MAVLLVEKSAYEVDLMGVQDQDVGRSKKRKGNVREPTSYPKSKDKSYAINHGMARGAFGGETDEILAQDIPFDLIATDEGLHSLVQTTKCRRKVLTAIYGNTTPCECILIMII